MDREQAVGIIKQICLNCQLVEGKSIKLLPSKEPNALSHTYQICIQQTASTSYELLQLCVDNIAAKNNLSIMVKDGWLIIYKPYEKSMGNKRLPLI
jgi:hypothetical protein